MMKNPVVLLIMKYAILAWVMIVAVPLKIIAWSRTLAARFKAAWRVMTGKNGIPNYLDIKPRPGSERVITECLRNDTMMTLRFYSSNTDLECIVNFKAMSSKSEDMTIPMEMTMATHVNKELKVVHFTGVAIPIAMWNEEQFRKAREQSMNGPSDDCPEVQVKVHRLDPGEAEEFLKRTDTIPPGSKVIN